MITPDSMPLWFFIPFAVILWTLLIVLVIRSAQPDPDPQYTQLDCWDGLDSRTD